MTPDLLTSGVAGSIRHKFHQANVQILSQYILQIELQGFYFISVKPVCRYIALATVKAMLPSHKAITCTL